MNDKERIEMLESQVQALRDELVRVSNEAIELMNNSVHISVHNALKRNRDMWKDLYVSY